MRGAKRKKRCKHGHRLADPNLVYGTNGRECKTCVHRRARVYLRLLKVKVVKAYGGKCNWRGCQINDPDMLQVDHVNNDGAAHRTTTRSNIYREILREKFPRRYQILCANHNMKKQMERLRNGV